MLQNLDSKPIYEVLDAIRNATGLQAKCQLYGILLKREGPDYEFNGTTGENQQQVSVCYCNSFKYEYSMYKLT